MAKPTWEAIQATSPAMEVILNFRCRDKMAAATRLNAFTTIMSASTRVTSFQLRHMKEIGDLTCKQPLKHSKTGGDQQRQEREGPDMALIEMLPLDHDLRHTEIGECVAEGPHDKRRAHDTIFLRRKQASEHGGDGHIQ